VQDLRDHHLRRRRGRACPFAATGQRGEQTQDNSWADTDRPHAIDVRRPEVNRETGIGAPGRRQTLPEMVRAYLAHRALPASVDRERFVTIGSELVESAERESPAGCCSSIACTS